MSAFVFGVFGLIIGSFLNVLVLRWGEKSLGGRSACMTCARQLNWYEMVPVFSWLALGGTCRTCKTRISIQYPLVEATTGIVFALVGSSGLALPTQICGCAMAALLIAISVYDLRHTLIPDAWVYAFILLAFISQVLFAPHIEFGIFLFLAGPIAALPLFLLWAVSRGAWMGFGDVKLALGIGWLLGPIYGVAAIFFGFVIGAVVSVGILLPLPYLMSVLSGLGITRLAHGHRGFTIGSADTSYRRRSLGSESEASLPSARWTMKSEIPFGPFLVASTFIVWLLLIHNLDPLSFVGLSP